MKLTWSLISFGGNFNAYALVLKEVQRKCRRPDKKRSDHKYIPKSIIVMITTGLC